MSIESINVSLRELPGRDLLGEKNVELLESTILGFRKAEESPNEEEQGSAAPNECYEPSVTCRFYISKVTYQCERRRSRQSGSSSTAAERCPLP